MTSQAPATYAGIGDRMTRQQWVAVSICVLLNVVDGFDILVMATAAQAVKADLGLSTRLLGVLLSASLAGMTLGALCIAPIADRLGRRPVILGCLVLEFVGMLLAGFARGPDELTISRFIAGLGVGGMMPVINTATAELASVRQRNLAITAQAIGYPLGGLLAAICGAFILETHGWRLLLQFACVPTVLAFVLVIRRLPESIDFLLARRPAGALGRINRALDTLGRPPLASLPPIGAASESRGVSALVRHPVAVPFALFSGATFCAQFSFYFLLSWLPTLLSPHLMGIPVPNAGSVALNLGGIMGDVIFGILCVTIAARRLTLGALLIAFAGVACLGLQLSSPVLVIVTSLVIGGALFAAMAGIYATAPRVFRPLVRAAGTGFAFSLGRLGGALAPLVGGVALGASGPGVPVSLVLLAAPLLVAALLLSVLNARPDTMAH